MLMGKVTGSSWKGSQVYISFNMNRDFSDPSSVQEWSKPALLYEKPGYILWYPSLQPPDSPEDVKERNTCLKLGKKARFFVKHISPGDDQYASEHIVIFEK
jgi:hypothetical protein